MTGGTADGALTAACGNIDKEQLSYKKYAAVRRREKRKGMKKYRQIMLAGLLFSVALMGCSSAAGGKQGETESKEEVSVQEQVETGTAGEAAILETDTVTAADEAGKDQTGVCLRLESDKNISGVELDGAEGFSCVRFDTEQIDLRKEFTIDI